VGTIKAILFVIFVVDSFFLVIAVLLQSGRGGGLAGALGGIGAADSALGVRAASQIEKATGIMAVIFLATALALAFLAGAAVPEPKVPRVGGIGTSPPAGIAPTTPIAGPAVTEPKAQKVGGTATTKPAGVAPTTPAKAQK